jgi:hypothetical protein
MSFSDLTRSAGVILCRKPKRQAPSLQAACNHRLSISADCIRLAQSQSRISLRGPLFLSANSGCSPIALPKSRKPLRVMVLERHFWTNLNHF